VSAARLLLIVVAGLLVLVAGMMSATLLDFEPGAWVAFGAFVAFVVARLAGWPGVPPGDFDFDGD
jgi:hypothetical protein